MSAAINVVCYKWKTLANGESPLMVRVAKGGKRTMQSLGISINPKYWDFTRNKPKPNCPNKEYIQKIILDKQRELQQRMLELNVEQKEYTTTTLLNNENTKFELKTVSEFYHELIEQYTREDKCGNRLIYKGSFNSLKAFTKGKLDANSYYNGETIGTPDIRVSHVIKGRIPEAIHKPANQLLESDKTIYYERAAFSIDIPTIYETVEGNKLNLSIIGVRAYNQMNLYSKKVPELFRLAIGFKNQVCCNMCIFTDGYKDDLRVSNTSELYRSALELFNNYNPAKHLHLMQQLGNTSMSEHQFAQILGKMRLYQCLPNGYQKRLPRMLLTDTQINSVAKAYINDENFGSFGNDLNMWKFYNLLTGANKSSYIDSFLDRSLNATEMAVGINAALHGDEHYKWFID